MDEKLISKEEGDGVAQAVGYIRCATNGVDAEAAAEAQKDKIQALADELGVEIADWHIDVGYSGADLNGPALQILLAAAQEPNHGIDVALVCDWGRLSRRLEILREIATTLSAAGIRLVSVEQGDYETSQKMLADILDAINEFYSIQQSEDTRRGLREATQQGYWVSARAPYGYRKVEVNGGGHRRWKLEIDPETSEVVRAMYDSADQDVSPRTIATDLNGQGVPSPLGGTWDAQVVLRVLLNPVNAGFIVYGKNSGNPVELRDACPAIVGREVFEKVKALRTRSDRRRVHLVRDAGVGGREAPDARRPM